MVNSRRWGEFGARSVQKWWSIGSPATMKFVLQDQPQSKMLVLRKEFRGMLVGGREEEKPGFWEDEGQGTVARCNLRKTSS